MREIVALMCMSMAAAVGILLLVFACAYKHFQTSKGSCWIWFVVFFYVLVPILAIYERRLRRILKAITSDTNFGAWIKQNKLMILFANLIADTMVVLISGFVFSSFALPVVLARGYIIKWGAVGAVWGGNFFILSAILAFFIHFIDESTKAIHTNYIYANSRNALWAILQSAVKAKADPNRPSQ